MNTPDSPNITREALMELTKTDNIDQLRRQLQNLAFGVGPTHTDKYGYEWTNRDLANLAAGMSASATAMLPHIDRLLSIFRELNSSSDGTGYFVSTDMDSEIGSAVVSLLYCVSVGMEPMKDPRMILTGRTLS